MQYIKCVRIHLHRLPVRPLDQDVYKRQDERSQKRKDDIGILIHLMKILRSTVLLTAHANQMTKYSWVGNKIQDENQLTFLVIYGFKDSAYLFYSLL